MQNWLRKPIWKYFVPLLAMIALSAVQSFAQSYIHNAVLFIGTSDKAWYNQVHWLIEPPYLLIIASNYEH